MSITTTTSLCIIIILSVLLASSIHMVFGFGHARWTYESSMLDSTSFIVDEPVTLEYISEVSLLDGTSSLNISNNILWSVNDNTCSILNNNNTITDLICTSIGSKRISLIRDNNIDTEDVFYITYSTRNCYDWYLAISTTKDFSSTFHPTNDALNHSSTAYARIWISDIHNMSPDELVGNATTPSSSSYSLTREFYQSGQHPSTYTSGGPHGFYISTVFSEWVFYYNDITGVSYWEAEIYTEKSEYFYLNIKGNGVGILNCGITDRRISISVIKYSELEIITTNIDNYISNLTLYPRVINNITNHNNIFHYRKDVCSENVMIGLLPGTNSVLFSQNHFNNINVWELSFLNNTNEVIDVLFTSNKILFLTNNSKIYINDGNSNIDFKRSSIINNNNHNNITQSWLNINRISGPRGCDVILSYDCSQSNINDIVFAWNQNNNNIIFISDTGGEYFDYIYIPNNINDIIYTFTNIYDVYKDKSSNRYILLVGNEIIYEQYIIYYNINNQKWSLGYHFKTNIILLSSSSSLSLPRVEPTATGSTEVYIYGDYLYYSFDNGNSIIPMIFINRNPQIFTSTHSSGLGFNEYILNINTDNNGHISVLTSYHRLFYGLSGVIELTELQSTIAPYNDLFNPVNILMSSFGEVNIIKTTTLLYPHVNINKIPIENEIMSPYEEDNLIIERETCPYEELNLIMDEICYIDMNGKCQGTIHMKSTNNQISSSLSSISVAVSDSKRLNSSRNSNIIHNDNIIIHETKVIFQESPEKSYINRNDRIERATGRVDMRVGVYPSNIMCNTVQDIRRANVGCPPGRHLRVRMTEDFTCNGNQVYVDPEKTLGQNGYCNNIDYAHEEQNSYTEDELSQLWPCAMTIYHQTTGFRPVIDVYDGPNYVEELKTNYVIYEVTGRKDYGYNATIRDARCHSQPVTWSELRHNNLKPWEWTPSYQRDCFMSDKDYPLLDLSKEYEIMNSTGISVMQFPVDGSDGMFYFKIQVVDPNYSYCKLNGRFALKVYGLPLSSLWIGVIVLISTMLIVIGLVITYFVRFKELSTIHEKED